MFKTAHNIQTNTAFIHSLTHTVSAGQLHNATGDGRGTTTYRLEEWLTEFDAVTGRAQVSDRESERVFVL